MKRKVKQRRDRFRTRGDFLQIFEKFEKMTIRESELGKISKNMEKICDIKEVDKPIAQIIKEVRELKEEEIEKFKEILGWPEEKFKKCTIDEDGIIHYKTDRCDLEGKMSENGVPYIRKTIEINGVKIEGVFPEFESVFDTSLKPENHKSKLYAKECNANLKEAIEQSSNHIMVLQHFVPWQRADTPHAGADVTQSCLCAGRP